MLKYYILNGLGMKYFSVAPNSSNELAASTKT